MREEMEEGEVKEENGKNGEKEMDAKGREVGEIKRARVGERRLLAEGALQ